MIALAPLVLIALQQAAVQGAVQGNVRGTAVDASTGVPVPAVQVRGRAARVTSDAAGRFSLPGAVGDTLRLRRVGYRPVAVVIAGDSIVVRLAPVAAVLGAVRVRADNAAEPGRMTASRDVGELRSAGVTTVADAVARLPLVSARSGRGEQLVSMRGSRAEQVVVTLDGMPLNDPATGTADVGDIPLVALGALTAAPGADAVRYGSGASGGVLALSSGDHSVLSAMAGAYGRVAVEGAARVPIAAGALRLGGGAIRAENDFPFLNDAGATGADSIERRVNNDERRLAAFASVVFPGVQAFALATEARRGLAGPKNVRAYDDDRETSRRALLRLAAQRGPWLAQGGLRALDVGYRDPRHPELDTRARVLSGDAELARALGPLSLRVGAGGDRVRATRVEQRARPRAFGALAHERAAGAYHLAVGARADAVRGSGVEPSWTLALEREGRIAPFGRLARGFRVPTLYDLYFAAPQRTIVRDLRPERALIDAELGVRATVRGATAVTSLFERRTHDAIVWFPGNFTWSPQNVARERVRGAEARLTVPLSFGEAGGWVAAYDTRLQAAGVALPTPYVPSLSGGGTLVLRRGAAAVTMTLRALGRRPYAVAPASTRLELPGVALTDVHASYRVRAARLPLLLTVGVDNVADVRWESVRRYPAAGRTWSTAITLEP